MLPIVMHSELAKRVLALNLLAPTNNIDSHAEMPCDSLSRFQSPEPSIESRNKPSSSRALAYLGLLEYWC